MTATLTSRYQELMDSSDDKLEELMLGAKAPDPESLAGWEFRGWNAPWFTSVLGIRKFVKGFFHGDGVEGYNIPVRQNGRNGEWLHCPSSEAPKRFGFYLVRPVQAQAKDNLYPNSLLLDYGASPRNMAVKPERVLRDYLAQPFPDNPDVLLGKAYLALAPGVRVPSNFFLLERLRPTPWHP